MHAHFIPIVGVLQNGTTRYWNYPEVHWRCASGLSAVNAIVMQLRDDPINSGLSQCWRMVVLINKWDAVAEIGKNPVSSTRFSLSMENEQADAGRDG